MDFRKPYLAFLFAILQERKLAVRHPLPALQGIIQIDSPRGNDDRSEPRISCLATGSHSHLSR